MLSSPDEPQRLKRPVEGFIPNPKLRLEEQCREVMRFKRFSFRTEGTYSQIMEKPGLPNKPKIKGMPIPTHGSSAKPM